MKQSHIEWCKNIFTSLTVGGVWAVPRSGLVFEKVSAEPPVLKLIDTSDPGGIKDGLLRYQQEETNVITSHFRAAGIEVKC